MAIEINGKVYRNLQEQVQKNMEDIEELQERVDDGYYTKEESDAKFQTKIGMSLYATQQQLNLNIAATEARTDLLLANKQDTLVSGTNIKTINGQPILGQGNIAIGGSGIAGYGIDITNDVISVDTDVIATKSDIYDLRWELGSHTLDVTTDTDTKYLKSVPSGAIGCQINKVGGMSHKIDNLINYKDIDSPKFTDLGNGSFQLDWRGGYVTITLPYSSFKANTQYSLTLTSVSGAKYWAYNMHWNYSDGTSENFTNNQGLNYGTYSYTSAAGKTLTSITWMINFEATFKDLILNVGTYFDGIRDSAVTSVVSKGANMLQLPNVAETTRNGITYKVENGVITLSGTATSGFTILFDLYADIPSGTYYSNFFTDNNALNFDLYFNNTSINVSDLSQQLLSFNTSVHNMLIFIASGRSYTNYVVKPMLVKGSTAPSEYKAYRGTIDNLTIHSAIQNLTGYGWGVNDTCYNYIDFDRKVFVQKVGRVDLGSLDWSNWGDQSALITTISQPAKEISNLTIPSVLSNYEAKSRSDIYNGNDGISINGSSAYYKGSGTPNGMLYYELATPVETDISAYLTTDTIDVEPNGTLEFTNTYSQDVPSDIDYLIEEVKA